MYRFQGSGRKSSGMGRPYEGSAGPVESTTGTSASCMRDKLGSRLIGSGMEGVCCSLPSFVQIPRVVELALHAVVSPL